MDKKLIIAVVLIIVLGEISCFLTGSSIINQVLEHQTLEKGVYNLKSQLPQYELGKITKQTKQAAYESQQDHFKVIFNQQRLLAQNSQLKEETDEQIQELALSQTNKQDLLPGPLSDSQSKISPFSVYNEGNIQAYDGNCIYRISNNRVKSVLANGPNIALASTLNLNSSFTLSQLHAKNNYLGVLGTYKNSSQSFAFLYIFSVNPATCLIDSTQNASYFKKGTYIGSRQRNSRLIIISEVLLNQFQYGWIINQFGSSSVGLSSNYGFISGYSQNYVRSVWSIKIDGSANSYYFEQYFFADHVDIISIANTQNLFLISNHDPNGTSPKFTIQIIRNILSTPFGPFGNLGNPGNFYGTVQSKFYVDEYMYHFRVVAKVNSTSNDHNLYVFRTPSLYLVSNRTISSGSGAPWQIHSCIFVYRHVILSSNHKIRVYDSFTSSFVDHSNTNYQKNYMFIYKNGATLFLMSFSTLGGKTAIILYRFLPTGLSVFNTYNLAQQYSRFVNIDSHQSFLLYWPTHTIVFGFENTNPNPVQNSIPRGMAYVYANAYNSCLSKVPFYNCPTPPSQTRPPIYKHWSQTQGTFGTAPSEIPDRFLVINREGTNYLYSSSEKQMQVRSIAGNPNLPNPPQSSNIVNF